jgi:flagellar motor switch/type III secretory pathway protein FliN
MLPAGLKGHARRESFSKPFPIVLYLFWSYFCMVPWHMATTQPPPPASKPPQATERTAAAEIAAEQALVPSLPQPEAGDLIALSGSVARLPVELDVAIPVREFRVRNLLALESGQVIETQWAHGEDMPLASGDVQLAWSEFEVVESQLAVRITRLA